MCFKNTLQNYGFVAKSFHWVMAIIIISLIAMGLKMVDMENSPDKFKVIGWHKEFGLVVLLLATLRLGWKILDVSPLLPDNLDKIAKLGAKAAHGLLYVLMFAMPLSGWLMSSAAGFPISLFGLFVMPNLIGPDKELGGLLRDAHETMAYILIGLITLHILAALLHHFYYKDNILRRMLPNFRRKNNADNSEDSTGC